MTVPVGSILDLKNIPTVDLVAENFAGTPTGVAGRIVYDTTALRMKVYENGAWVLASQTGAELTANKNASGGYAGLDGSTKVIIGQIPTGTTSSTVPFGNDARFSDDRFTPRVRLASTANVTISTGLITGQSIDGVALVTGDRVLLKNQTTASENGVYVAAASSPGRASDVLTANSMWIVAEGTANADMPFHITTNNPITTGTTALTIAQFAPGGAPSGTAGGDLAGTYPNPTIALLAVTAAKMALATITDAQVAAANKDGSVGVASMRTIGTGSLQAMAGNTTLSSIAAPTGAVSMNSQRITSVANATNATDAINRNFLYGTTLDLFAPPAADFSAGGFKITNLAAPTVSTDAARLSDVQNAQSGIDLKPSVRAASTVNQVVSTDLVNGATIDGVTLATGDRVLLKNQSTASQNGSYTVASSGTASRTSDVITANTMWFVEEGTANADTAWMVTTNGAIILGATGLTIAQFGSGSLTYTGTTNRITVTGTVIDISASYVGQTSITTLGTIGTGTWNGTSIAVLNGGTGSTTAAGARTNLGATGKYSATLAALVANTELNINHNLNTTEVNANFRDASTGNYTILAWRVIDANNIGVTADIAYSTSSVKVVVVG